MREGKLNSSCGFVVFDCDSGVVTNCELDPDGYSPDQCPAVVDVDEWRARYPGEWGALENNHDILDFGYWKRDGSYEPPCESWRKERAEMIEEENKEALEHGR